MKLWLRSRLRDCQKLIASVRLYRAPPVESIWRFAKLMINNRYSPVEIFMFALLDPKKTEEDIAARYFSNETLLRLQRHLNPLDAHFLTASKAAFFSHCVAGGLPTPRVLAVFSSGKISSSKPLTGVRHLATEEEWIEFFSRIEAESLVLKPIAGAHGEGVLVLRRTALGFEAASGRRYSAGDLLGYVRQSVYESWLIQERITSHQSLSGLSRTDYIQTARLVTYIDNNRDVQFIGARFRIIGGVDSTDNFNFGLAGNLIASVDIKSGRIKNAVTMRSDFLGLVRVLNHPVTGRELIGFEIPCWQHAIDLAVSAARHFFPLRTVGWDIAITDRGVCLIEGNENWDSGFYELDYTNEYALLLECAIRDGNHAARTV